MSDPGALEIVEYSIVIGKVCIEGHLFVFADFIIISIENVISKTGSCFNLVQVYEELQSKTGKYRMLQEISQL